MAQMTKRACSPDTGCGFILSLTCLERGLNRDKTAIRD